MALKWTRNGGGGLLINDNKVGEVGVEILWRDLNGNTKNRCSISLAIVSCLNDRTYNICCVGME